MCVCIYCVCMHAAHIWLESALSFYHVGPRNWIQVMRLSGKWTLLSESCHISNLSLLAASFQENWDGQCRKWQEGKEAKEKGEEIVDRGGSCGYGGRRRDNLSQWETNLCLHWLWTHNLSRCINGKVKTEDWKYPYPSSCVLELWVIWMLEIVANVLPHEETQTMFSPVLKVPVTNQDKI